MSETKVTQREAPGDNGVFSQAELERMLESIDHWWHRHGYEEQEEVKEYIRKLYEFVPADLRDGVNEDLVHVPLRELYRLLRDTLGPVFGQVELAEEIDRLQKALMEEGSMLEHGILTMKRGFFLSTFDDFFDPEEMSQELVEQVQQIKEYLVN